MRQWDWRQWDWRQWLAGIYLKPCDLPTTGFPVSVIANIYMGLQLQPVPWAFWEKLLLYEVIK